MPETDAGPNRWRSLTRSVSTKLILLLSAALLAIFSLLGFLNIRLHRQELDASTLAAAERVSDLIRRSTRSYMLNNDREGLHSFMQTIGGEPGIVKLRIFDQTGHISFSTDATEVDHIVDQSAEACYGCHAQSQPLSKLNRPDRFRIYRNGGGKRVLGIITPIENQPDCSNAACHAHPASQQVLGVLDANLSLAKADAQLAAGSRDMAAYTILALTSVALLSWVFVWRVVGGPIAKLEDGTKQLSRGDLGYQIEVGGDDEIGDLARSFNHMSLLLRRADEENAAWTKTLEDRVEQKSRELKRAHDHVLHVEKMASIGKLAAIVAHEVNNPLSGILTYAKLIKKWVERGETIAEKRQEAIQCLDLIAGESRRCGELIKNLLTFSRTAPMNVRPASLDDVIGRALKLVEHQLEMNGVQLQCNFAPHVPVVQCDPDQIEQVLLALVMNAVDAMPKGGNLWLSTRLNQPGEVEIEVRDDGTGIPPEIMPQIFEPFLTTKDVGKGVGLGLAISRGIMERHGGKIEVQSEYGKGTTFTLTLPLESSAAAWAEAPPDIAAATR